MMVVETGSTAVHHTLLMHAKSSKLIALPVSNIKAKLHRTQQKVPEYLPQCTSISFDPNRRLSRYAQTVLLADKNPLTKGIQCFLSQCRTDVS